MTAGERDLFRVLVVRYGALAQRTALLCGAGADADDVVQESFVAAYRALPRFRVRESFRPWLLRIVINQAHNAVRGRQRARALADRVAGWHTAVLDDEPVSNALTVERRAALVRALGDLREADREILALRYLLDLSEAETATALRLPKGTVKSRTARALERLRCVLADDGSASRRAEPDGSGSRRAEADGSGSRRAEPDGSTAPGRGGGA
ncbi:RNA polymerase sigma factor [Rugosimonospora africana]|uniref:RNA polymerase sigma factor n=1 Tax=Rugosimonospora africana TaxID=556532 RepID=UPI001EF24ACB|nr:RNA polymerase sigma factor [Rugosimonospora africana]